MNAPPPYNKIIISIIIPIYRVEKYIANCIKSVIKQSYPLIEIILVDDCGGDKSIYIAESILSKTKLNWKTVKHETNKGLSVARNTGVKKATGDYLFFLDSDDTLAPNAIHDLIQKAIETGAKVLFGNFQYQKENAFFPSSYFNNNDNLLQISLLEAHIKGLVPSIAWNRLIKKEWYLQSKLSFKDGIIHEDELWSLEMAFKTPNFSYINNITYIYNQRENSIIHSENNIKQKIHGKLSLLKFAHSMRSQVTSQILPLYYKWYNSHLYHLLLQIEQNELHKKKQLIHETLLYFWIANFKLIKSNKNPHIVVMTILSYLLPTKLCYTIVKISYKAYKTIRYYFCNKASKIKS